MPHLLRNGTSVYHCHRRGRMTLKFYCLAFDSGGVLSCFNDLRLHWDFNTKLPKRDDRSNRLRHRQGVAMMREKFSTTVKKTQTNKYK